MALNIAQRPQGVVLSTTPLSATITSNSGDALVTYVTHDLTTGDMVFITSDYSYYNGFWQVLVISADTFEIRNHTYADSVLYVVGANITFYKTVSTHYFSSVHLPIVYKLQNTLWPTNSVDTARTMTVTNSAGYCAIVASGDIKATGSAQELEYVKITTVAGTYDGVYKIIDYSSDTSFTIDLEYSAAAETSLELGTSTIQYYYSNYHANVRIYAGITGTGAVIKPVALITEVEAVPDSDNIITLNINEFLKSKVDILLNDPALVTMPRDIHAFCEFYITYAESYDITLGGYTLGTYVSSYTDDSATVGYAVNSKLPFKNRYSGFMSEYLGTARKFLTMFTEPVYSPLGHSHAGVGFHFVGTLASNQATGANVTPVTLTGLVFSYIANSSYRIWAMGRVQPTAATTGCGFQFDLSSVVTAINVQFFHQLASAGTLSGGHSIADDASVGVSSGMPATGGYPVTVHGLLVTGDNAGTASSITSVFM